MNTTPASNLPQGLLALLGIKSHGEYPKLLGDVMTPTLEVAQWIAHTNGNVVHRAESLVGVTQNSGNYALTTPLLMSSTEWWLVTELWTGIVITGATATSGGFTLGHTDETALGFTPLPGQSGLPYAGATGIVGIANARYITLASHQEPFLIAPRSGGQFLIQYPRPVVLAAGETHQALFKMRYIALRA